MERQQSSQIQESMKRVAKDARRCVMAGTKFANRKDIANKLGLQEDRDINLLHLVCGIKLLDAQIEDDTAYVRKYDESPIKSAFPLPSILNVVAYGRKRIERSRLTHTALEEMIHAFISKNYGSDNAAKPYTIQLAINMLFAIYAAEDQQDQDISEDFYANWAEQWKKRIDEAARI